MAIKPISRDEFDRFDHARSPMAEIMFEESEWFADDNGIVIGVIALDKSDKDWSVGVLGKDERGQFRAIDMKVSIENIQEARTTLMEKMEKALASGETVFPQGD